MDCCAQLHCHSSFSFKDGQDRPEQLAARAAELGQPGMGLTEHGHVYSASVFAKACADHGIKPVHGCEIYESISHTWDPDPAGPHHGLFKSKYDPDNPRYFHLTLWVLNQTGWENLVAIHTQSFTSGYKPKNQPMVDRATLERHHEGLLVGLGCPQSRTNRALQREGMAAAIAQAKWYFEVFEDRVYVEVMSALPEQVGMLADQRSLAKYFNRPTVGTNDVHYRHQVDGALGGPHHMLVMARKFKSKDSSETESGDQSDASFGSYYGSDQFYLKTRQEMVQAGIFAPEIDTSLEILDRVEFDFLAMAAPQPPTAHVPAFGADPAFEAYVGAHT